MQITGDLGARHAGRNSRAATLSAVAVAALFLVSGLMAIDQTHASGATSSPRAVAPPAITGSATRSSPEPSVAPSAGACSDQGSSGDPANGASPSDAVTAGSTGPGPLFNSQVQPYATVTGAYAYVAAGAALRDQGYGAIQLDWPGGSTSNLVAAYMIWSILNDSVPADNGTLNGHNISGTWTAYATPSPCWSPTYVYTFVADVSSDVVNGNNTLTGFPSGITSGVSPWSTGGADPYDEGVSLVAIYQNGSVLHQVTVYTGAFPVAGGAPDLQSSQLNYSATNSSTAESTFIVADGQELGNDASWNGSVVDANAFYGSDPKESHQVWSEGNLSDTITLTGLPVQVGGNNTTASVSSEDGDCLTWVGQVLSVGVAATKGPYPVRFVEQGLPSGTSWSITTGGHTKSGTAGSSPTAIAFSLANASYTYSVGALSGYLTAPTSGSYVVAGGPVTIRIIFHAYVYPLVFAETGLPYDATWWVDLTNASQNLAINQSGDAPESISQNVSNGTYEFTTGTTGLYLPDTASGTATVSGSSVTVTITFRPPPLYDVTFEEQNLTPGCTRTGASSRSRAVRRPSWSPYRTPPSTRRTPRRRTRWRVSPMRTPSTSSSRARPRRST
jgi:hypothetical protein